MRRSRTGADVVGGTSMVTAGALASSTWLASRALSAPPDRRWHVEIALSTSTERAPVVTEHDGTAATSFHLDIYAEEWGFHVEAQGQSSWIRVTDIAFVHGRDDFRLMAVCPPLEDIGVLLRRFEQQHEVRFQRQHAAVTTNLNGAESTLRSWILSL
jgi:hypothetical protein